MLTQETAGLKPCETTGGSNRTTSGCSRCDNTADGYDATIDGPLCTPCAETRTNDDITVGQLSPTKTTQSLSTLSAAQHHLLWVFSQIDPDEVRPFHCALTEYYHDGIDASRICNRLVDLVEHDLLAKHPHDHTVPTYRLTELGRPVLSIESADTRDPAGTQR